MNPRSPKAYHPKRPHKKSRGGCRNCKTRKIKCSEDRPKCKTCVLRMEECIYGFGPARPPSHAVAAAAAAGSSATSLSISSSSSSSSSSASSSSPPSFSSPPYSSSYSSSSSSSTRTQPSDTIATHVVLASPPQSMPPPVIGGSDSLEMKLLWFYTAKGCESFSTDIGEIPTRQASLVNEVLRVAIPRTAFQHRFLLDFLLGLSAIHLNHLGEEKVPESRIISYNNAAMAGYRQAVSMAKPETFNALLVCSLFVCALSSESFRGPDPQPLFILDWIVIWGGITVIYHIILKHSNGAIPKESVPTPGIALLFSRPPLDAEEAGRFIPGNLLSMVASLHEGDPEYPYRQAYYDTLKLLGALYMDLEQSFGSAFTLRIITFFTFVPSSFVQAARERRPRALVMIAYWLAFSKLARNTWWMKGLADHEVHNIYRVLPDGFGPIMSVPLAAVEIDDPTELGQLLTENHLFRPVQRRLADLPPNKLPMLLTSEGYAGELSDLG